MPNPYEEEDFELEEEEDEAPPPPDGEDAEEDDASPSNRKERRQAYMRAQEQVREQKERADRIEQQLQQTQHQLAQLQGRVQATPQEDPNKQAFAQVDARLVELRKQYRSAVRHASAIANDEKSTAADVEAAEQRLFEINDQMQQANVQKTLIGLAPKPKSQEEQAREQQQQRVQTRYQDIYQNPSALETARHKLAMEGLKRGQGWQPTEADMDAVADSVRREYKLGPYMVQEPTGSMKRATTGLEQGSRGAGGKAGKKGPPRTAMHIEFANRLYSEEPDPAKRWKMYSDGWEPDEDD